MDMQSLINIMGYGRYYVVSVCFFDNCDYLFIGFSKIRCFKPLQAGIKKSLFYDSEPDWVESELTRFLSRNSGFKYSLSQDSIAFHPERK